MRRPKPGPGLLERPGTSLSPETVASLAARALEGATRGYRICGRILRLRTDSREYARAFAEAFRRLAADGVDARGEGPHGRPLSELTFLTREAGPDGFPALLDPALSRARVFAHEEVEPTQLFFALAFLEGRMFPLPDHAVLHASTLERDGEVTAVVGRSHSGKTTLGLALALEPGARFLSDEFCPVRLADGAVEPFPRALGLRRRTRALLAARGALDPAVAADARDDLTLDPLDVPGLTLGRGGGRVRNVICVAGEAGEPVPEGVRDLDLEFVDDSVLADLRAVPGVRAVAPRPEPVAVGRAVRVAVEPGARMSEALVRVCTERHGMQICYVLPPGARRPDFTRPPELRPMSTLAGLTELLRHFANAKALGDQLGGATYPRLLDCLARVLGGARFFALRPGPLDDTVRLVRERVQGMGAGGAAS